MKPLPRQSRHPVVVGTMSCVAALSAWQIVSGPTHFETAWHLPGGSYEVLSLFLLIGALSCLSATVQSDSWTAAAFELLGSIMLLGPLVIYYWAVASTAMYPDTDIVSALLAGLIIGLTVRILTIFREAVSIMRERRAPPVGDLDLLTADHVDGVASLVAEQQIIGSGGGGHAA